MAVFTCPSCNVLLHTRFRSRLSLLAFPFSRSQTRYKSTKKRPQLEIAEYWDTVPPTAFELDYATEFFETHRPRRLWTATEWRRQQPSSASREKELGPDLVPEIVFLGRSNVGKSSIINALLKAPNLNPVGDVPGKTKTMNAWGLSASNPITGGAGPGGKMDVRLAVIDMPGYGFGSYDKSGDEIVTYLTKRKQLRRVFLLIDGLHGLKANDANMIKLLRFYGISHQLIVSRADRLLATSERSGHLRLKEFFEYLRREVVQSGRHRGSTGLGEIMAVGGLAHKDHQNKVKELRMLGIQQVRWAVLVAAGLNEWATGETSATTPDRTKTVENASTKGAGEARLFDLWRTVKDMGPHVYTPPWMAIKERPPDPVRTSSHLSNLIGDRKSTTPLSFLTGQHKLPRQDVPPSPHPAPPATPPPPSSPISLPPLHSGKSHNPVDGLAELRSLSSSARRKPTSTWTKMVDPSKQKKKEGEKGGVGKGKDGRDMSAYQQAQTREKGATEIQRLMGEESSHTSNNRDDGTSIRPSSMTNGIGVGRMADLLALSGGGGGAADKPRGKTAKDTSSTTTRVRRKRNDEAKSTTTTTKTKTKTTKMEDKPRKTPIWIGRGKVGIKKRKLGLL